MFRQHAADLHAAGHRLLRLDERLDVLRRPGLLRRELRDDVHERLHLGGEAVFRQHAADVHAAGHRLLRVDERNGVLRDADLLGGELRDDVMPPREWSLLRRRRYHWRQQDSLSVHGRESRRLGGMRRELRDSPRRDE